MAVAPDYCHPENLHFVKWHQQSFVWYKDLEILN